jgi:hypothetical protein
MRARRSSFLSDIRSNHGSTKNANMAAVKPMDVINGSWKSLGQMSHHIDKPSAAAVSITLNNLGRCLVLALALFMYDRW